MRKKENTSAKQQNKELATAGSKKETNKNSKQIKIKIIGPVAGVFGLSANINDIILIDKKQAAEIVNAKCAKYI